MAAIKNLDVGPNLPTACARPSLLFVAGVIILGGYFGHYLDNSITAAMVLASASTKELETPAFVRHGLTFSFAMLLVATILLIAWIVWGERAIRRWPWMVAAGLGIAMLPFVLKHLLMGYVLLVHGVS